MPFSKKIIICIDSQLHESNAYCLYMHMGSFSASWLPHLATGSLSIDKIGEQDNNIMFENVI